MCDLAVMRNAVRADTPAIGSQRQTSSDFGVESVTGHILPGPEL